MVFSSLGIEDQKWAHVVDFLKEEVIAIAVCEELAFGQSLVNLRLDYCPAQFYFTRQVHRICVFNSEHLNYCFLSVGLCQVSCVYLELHLEPLHYLLFLRS